jgi:hypothetical protein
VTVFSSFFPMELAAAHAYVRATRTSSETRVISVPIGVSATIVSTVIQITVSDIVLRFENGYEIS